jgi:hypothetical protein
MVSIFLFFIYFFLFFLYCFAFFILHATALRSWHKCGRFLPPPGRSQLMRSLSPAPPPGANTRKKQKKRKKKKTRRKTPSLSSCCRRRSGSLLPLLLLPLSCGPACPRLNGVASAPANEDGDFHAPSPDYISPGWDVASRPHLHLSLPFPSLPFHLLPSLFRLNRVNTGRF